MAFYVGISECLLRVPREEAASQPLGTAASPSPSSGFGGGTNAGIPLLPSRTLQAQISGTGFGTFSSLCPFPPHVYAYFSLVFSLCTSLSLWDALPLNQLRPKRGWSTPLGYAGDSKPPPIASVPPRQSVSLEPLAQWGQGRVGGVGPPGLHPQLHSAPPGPAPSGG